GLIVALANPGIAMAFDATTFVASAAFLAFLHLPTDAASVRSGQPLVGELVEGWREFTARSWVWVSVLTFGIYQLALFPAIMVLGPAIADQHLSGATGWAAILTA